MGGAPGGMRGGPPGGMRGGPPGGGSGGVGGALGGMGGAPGGMGGTPGGMGAAPGGMRGGPPGKISPSRRDSPPSFFGQFGVAREAGAPFPAQSAFQGPGHMRGARGRVLSPPGSPLAENLEYVRTRGDQPSWSQSDSVAHLGAGSTSYGSRYGSQADGRKRGARGRLSGPDATAAPRTGFATAVVDETYYSTSPGVDYDSWDFHSERESEDPYPSNGAPPWPQKGMRSWLYTGRPLPPWRQRGPGTGRY